MILLREDPSRHIGTYLMYRWIDWLCCIPRCPRGHTPLHVDARYPAQVRAAGPQVGGGEPGRCPPPPPPCRTAPHTLGKAGRRAGGRAAGSGAWRNGSMHAASATAACLRWRVGAAYSWCGVCLHADCSLRRGCGCSPSPAAAPRLQVGAADLVIDSPLPKHTVYVYGCKDSVLQVRGGQPWGGVGMGM